MPKKIFLAIKDEKIECYFTVKSLADIHYVTKHILHDENKARDILSNLLSLLKLCDSKASDASKAIDSLVNDYEDALMIETASSTKLDYIVTRNIKDYKNSLIPVILPK